MSRQHQQTCMQMKKTVYPLDRKVSLIIKQTTQDSRRHGCIIIISYGCYSSEFVFATYRFQLCNEL